MPIHVPQSSLGLLSVPPILRAIGGYKLRLGPLEPGDEMHEVRILFPASPKATLIDKSCRAVICSLSPDACINLPSPATRTTSSSVTWRIQRPCFFLPKRRVVYSARLREHSSCVKRSSYTLKGVAVLAALVAIWCGVRVRQDDPAYQGKRLSKWLEIGYTSGVASPGEKQAAEAVRQIGTNALPYLLTSIAYTPSYCRQAAMNLERRFPRKVNAGLHVDRLIRGSGGRRAEMAVFGFSALGLNAKGARAQLWALAHSENPVVRARAVAALAACDYAPDREVLR